MNKFFDIKKITLNAFIAALYVLLSIISGPLAFIGGQIQIRLSEILIFLVFFNPSYIVGISIGCLISNIFSMYGIFDVILGTSTTIISSLLIVLISKKFKKLILVIIINSIINALIIPLIYLIISQDLSLYFINLIFVFVSELIILIFGYILFIILSRKNAKFLEFIKATQNIDFKW